jgi:orotidine-5'-phosphate decarboxylase
MYFVVVRKVLQCSSEVEDMLDPDETEMKLKLYEKLGDLCCSLKAYPAAIGFYGQQVLWQFCYTRCVIIM